MNIPKMPLRSKIILALLILTMIFTMVRGRIVHEQEHERERQQNAAATTDANTNHSDTMTIKVIGGVLSAAPANDSHSDGTSDNQ